MTVAVVVIVIVLVIAVVWLIGYGDHDEAPRV